MNNIVTRMENMPSNLYSYKYLYIQNKEVLPLQQVKQQEKHNNNQL